MAEVGVVRFAHVAREVAEAVLPASRSTYSQHLFAQPSLLAVLCLMRSEEWTFREAEVRLGEQQELRRAHGLKRVPVDTTRYRVLRRLDGEVMTRALTAAVPRLPPATPGGMVVAVDATGVSPTAARHSFVDRTRTRGAEQTWHHWAPRHWPQCVVAVEAPRRLVLGQLAYAGPATASSTLRPVVDLARQTGVIGPVVANAEFESGRNQRHLRDQLGADSVIPAKRGRPAWHLHGVRAPLRASFPAARSRQRTPAGSIFSAAKRTRSARAPGRLPVTWHLQTLLLGLAYDLYRVRRRLLLSLDCRMATKPRRFCS
jgi:hypothetical protein